MKQDAQNGMKRVSVNVDYLQALVIIKNVEMMINAGVFIYIFQGIYLESQ